MARLELMLLGGFQARVVPGGAIKLPTRKAQALLAYLALPLGRLHPRDKLSALLWADVSESQARRSLRKALSWLRQALTDTGALSVDGEMLGLELGAVTTDVGEFERLVAVGSAAALAESAALYRGDFLAGLTLEEAPFEEWLIGERERLRELSIDAMARLLAHQRDAGAVNDAIQTAVKLVAVDPLQEPVHRTLMRLYAQAGRRGAALRQYQACLTVLERELRTQPEEATKALYREILQSRETAVPSPSEDRAPAGQFATATFDRAAQPGVGPPQALAEAPLIGRRRELAQLTALLEEAWAGGRRSAVISGEAGVGKSRLAAALGALAVEHGGRVLTGRCYESERSSASIHEGSRPSCP
jgi:DNA-binding SARP family transcriptional activator